MSKWSQNGYPVLEQSQTFRWDLPLKGTTKRHLILKPGDAGFVLAHFALWYHERVESITSGVWDDWGWASRPVRGSSTIISNHASGTAMDLNAVKHPLGAVGTLKFWVARVKGQNGLRKEYAIQRINRFLNRKYNGVIRSGAFYQHRKDEMHYEINTGTLAVSRLAAKLRKSKRGKRLIKANPGYRF